MINEYTHYVLDLKPNDSDSDHIFRDYLTVIYFVQYIFQEGDELLDHLVMLNEIGNTLWVLLTSERLSKIKAVDSEIHKNKKLFRDTSNEIQILLQKRYNLAIGTSA